MSIWTPSEARAIAMEVRHKRRLKEEKEMKFKAKQGYTITQIEARCGAAATHNRHAQNRIAIVDEAGDYDQYDFVRRGPHYYLVMVNGETVKE